jgi:hypothetical protein
MRTNSVIILLAITFSILSPISVHLTIAHGQPSIGTFDVCHAGSLAISASSDAPCVSQPIYHPDLPLHVEFAKIIDPTLQLFSTTSQDEHPPKI